MLSKISILLTNHQLTLKDISQNQHLAEQDLKKNLMKILIIGQAQFYQLCRHL
ncbi:hypothetical protein HMPREF9209_1294 [Lactobacillus gasseri 224-1]|uniref:Uncharacterized protein n=1 Tax=Lactobacillus gasseri 224-1 TaxID=679196 RepID=D1YG98_LACGS|nr:hypothetical protein HMPREF9209_1294 [Lactobacillus gasseri 224-1]EFQ46463.1 hypothetical protein LBGG_02061 [Lactobacillus gasseri MV-22]